MADTLQSLSAPYLKDLRERRERVRVDLEAARRRRDELRSLPVSAEELVERLMVYMDLEARSYTVEIERLITGTSQLSAYAVEVRLAWCAALLSTILRDQAREGLLKMVKNQGRRFGPAYAERQRRIGEMEKSIKALEAQDASIGAELDSMRKELEPT